MLTLTLFTLVTVVTMVFSMPIGKRAVFISSAPYYYNSNYNTYPFLWNGQLFDCVQMHNPICPSGTAQVYPLNTQAICQQIGEGNESLFVTIGQGCPIGFEDGSYSFACSDAVGIITPSYTIVNPYGLPYNGTLCGGVWFGVVVMIIVGIVIVGAGMWFLIQYCCSGRSY